MYKLGASFIPDSLTDAANWTTGVLGETAMITYDVKRHGVREVIVTAGEVTNMLHTINVETPVVSVLKLTIGGRVHEFSERELSTLRLTRLVPITRDGTSDLVRS